MGLQAKPIKDAVVKRLNATNHFNLGADPAKNGVGMLFIDILIDEIVKHIKSDAVVTGGVASHSKIVNGKVT